MWECLIKLAGRTSLRLEMMVVAKSAPLAAVHTRAIGLWEVQRKGEKAAGEQRWSQQVRSESGVCELSRGSSCEDDARYAGPDVKSKQRQLQASSGAQLSLQRGWRVQRTTLEARLVCFRFLHPHVSGFWPELLACGIRLCMTICWLGALLPAAARYASGR